MKAGFKAHYFRELIELESANFWFKARNRLILWSIGRYAPSMTSFLEIGCGTGYVLSAVASQFPATSLVGSEYLHEGLVYARQRLPGVDFIQMDARHISFANAFDAIGAFDVIEHIEEDETVLRQIHAALKPDGVVLITVPQHAWLWSTVDVNACHVRRYSAGELHRKVTAAGFDIIRSTSFVSSLLPAMAVSRFFRNKKEAVKVDEVAELRINPLLNRLFEWMLVLETRLIRAGVDLPFGGSRLLLAKKIT